MKLISESLKKYISSDIRIRGQQYFESGKAYISSHRIENNSCMLFGEVHGHKIYQTVVWYELDTFQPWGICNCLSFNNDGICKHIMALALQVDKEYTISDDGKITKKSLIPEWKQQNKLSIFSQISKQQSFQETEQKEALFYKVKLNFVEKYKNTHDITINLYKWKLLKNGNISSWTKVKREWLENWVPNKFIILSPFLEDRNSAYSRMNQSQLTFISSQKAFFTTLCEFDELVDINNKPVFLEKEIYQWKLHIEKKPNDMYDFSLVLSSKNKYITLKKERMFWDESNTIFWVLFTNNHLVFFKSDLNIQFMKKLSWEEVILTKEDMEKLKKQPYFSTLLENLDSIEMLDIAQNNFDIHFSLIVEIPDDLSVIQLNFVLWYDDIKIPLEKLSKEVLIENKKIIQRDMKKETQIFSEFEGMVDMCDEYSNYNWKKYIDENLDPFFDEIEKLLSNGIEIIYQQKTKRISNWWVKIKINVSSWVDFFDIESKVFLWEKEIEDASSIMKAIKNKSKSITLENGNTILLKNDVSQSTKELESLWISEKDIWKSIKIGKHMIWLLKETTEKNNFLNFSLDTEIRELKKKFHNFKNIKQTPLVSNSQIVLRDYQKIWFYWIHFLKEYNFSWILADDMGLWKTVQTLAFLEKLFSLKTQKHRVLIICPTSVVFNWIDEIQKFTPHLKSAFIKDGKIWFDDISKDTQIIIVSYGIIANLVDSNRIKETFEYVIIDEAQNIKNPTTQRTKSINLLKSKYRLALSWTPIENNLIELWSIFNFLMPWFLWTLNHFKSLYSSQDKESLEILSRKVKPFILRRTKEKVLQELPPKVEEYIKLEMWEKQKAFYTKLKNHYKLQLEQKIDANGLNKSRFEVLDALLKLRQACLVPELTWIEWWEFCDSVKLDYIDENIEDMIDSGHNLLIFSQFTWFLSYLQKLLSEKNISYHYLDGWTPGKERKTLVDSFNSGNVNVFIISLKAGWTGLNLTSADYVIHLDPWWNPAVENQATDRAHRMGQKKTVFVQKLIVRESIEEKILQLQEGKKKLIDDIFSGNFSGSLDKKDIDFIFS